MDEFQIILKVLESQTFLTFKTPLAPPEFKEFSSIRNASQGSICFYSGNNLDFVVSILKKKPLILILQKKDIYDKLESKNTWVVNCRDSREGFARLYYLLQPYFKYRKETFPSKSNSIDPSVTLGVNCYIEENVTIDKGCRIDNNVSILNGTKIGKNVTIKSGSVIGGDGFGYLQIQSSSPIKFPHLSNVVIDDDVEIGSNTCIDRGALEATVIGKGVKIDNLVHVAHGVTIGESSLIIAGAVICGSASIGKRCWIAPNSSIKEGVIVGDESIVGLGSVVLRNVPPRTIVAGNPAKPLPQKTSE